MSHHLFKTSVCFFIHFAARLIRPSLTPHVWLVLCAGLLLASSSVDSKAWAADITWGGIYRVEGVKIQNPTLSAAVGDKSYLLHHMVLFPKIVAADGVTIYGRMDVLNNPTLGVNQYGQIESVAGDVLGSGPGGLTELNPGAASPNRGSDSNAYGTTQRASFLSVSQLYASWNHEFGQLVIGRAPLQFGLGTAYSAGNGLFDHFMTTRDMIGYRMVLGNLFLMPIKTKVSQAALDQYSDVDEYIVHVQYDNPETELSLGLMHNVRVVTGNDAPTPAGFTRSGSFKNTLTSVFFSQKATEWLRAAVEADIYSGDAGLINASGMNVGINAWGLAGEFSYLPTNSAQKWGGGVKLGLVTGDDPGTTDTNEGFAFHRNYDVGMLLFNHPLGQADFMRTYMIRDVTNSASKHLDDEAVSNAAYIAPSLTYKSRDNLSYGLTFVYARLNKDPIGTNSNTSLDLGYEFDLSVTYKPMERFTWITEFAALIPGNAWKGSSAQNFETKMPYGIQTKAAISF